MPRRLAHIGLIAGLVALLALGSIQGTRLRHLRESERFYRWLDGVTAEVYLVGQDAQGRPAEQWNTGTRALAITADAVGSAAVLPAPTGFAGALGSGMVAALSDPAIASGKPRDRELFSRVLAATRGELGGDPNAPESEAALVRLMGEGDPEGVAWGLAKSPLLREAREDFHRYLNAGQLAFARDVDIAEAQSSGVNLFNLFFGFRKIAANFVWLQVDKYWHMGMTHRMLPLMKTTVMLDPKFVDAYLVGAWHLAYNLTAGMGETKPQDKQWLAAHNVLAGEKERYYYMAVDYLDDGIRNNPREYKLYFEQGFAHFRNKLHDYANAVRYLTQATRLPHERWVPRQLYQCMELNRQYRDALRGWRDYLRRFPDNIVAPRFIKRNEALLEEQEGDRILADARAAEDPETRQEKRQLAFQAYDKAKAIYGEMNESFAVGRVYRIEALKLAEEGRHLEAIALLEHARWQSSAFWDEASRLIIEYKQQAGIPLSTSEKKAVLRETDEETRLRLLDQDSAESP